MKEITPEGTTYLYFTLQEVLPTSDTSDLIVRHRESLAIMERYLPKSDDIRVVLVRFRKESNEAWPYYLYWDDGTDLIAVDNRVIQNTYTDADFLNAVKTEYVPTICFVCNRRWHSLVMPTGDPYLGTPGLDVRKMAARKFLKCPGCNSPFRIGVLKILDEAVLEKPTTTD